MIVSRLRLLLLNFLPSFAVCHMSIWDQGMFAFDGYDGCTDDCQAAPAYPLGPGLSQDDWWFRGPKYRTPKVLPTAANATVLPAGGKWNTEITCHKAYSKYGVTPSTSSDQYDACPGSAAVYHADPNNQIVNASLIAGCALGITDTTDVSKVTMDNIAIFTIQPNCVKQKDTSFDIPAEMPACTGDYCICSWFWMPYSGKENYYMTGFYCKITGATSTKAIGAPQDPVHCASDSTKCVKGPKKPLFAYNANNNSYATGWDKGQRPGYSSDWSWTIQGAQTDIFTGSGSESGSAAVSKSSSAKTSQSVKASASSSAPLAANLATTSSSEATTSATGAVAVSTNAASPVASTPLESQTALEPAETPSSGSTATDTPVSEASATSLTSSSSTQSRTLALPWILVIVLVILIVLAGIFYLIEKRRANKESEGDEEKRRLASDSSSDSDDDR